MVQFGRKLQRILRRFLLMASPAARHCDYHGYRRTGDLTTLEGVQWVTVSCTLTSRSRETRSHGMDYEMVCSDVREKRRGHRTKAGSRAREKARLMVKEMECRQANLLFLIVL
jgi:hypothetical protein